VTGAETGLSGLTNVHIHRGIEDVALAEMYRNVGVLLLPLADSTANNALREGMGQRAAGCSDRLACGARVCTRRGRYAGVENTTDGFITALESFRRDVSLRRATRLRRRAI